MRKFKTAADNRTNYIYYFDDGSKCVITPGENGENTTINLQLLEGRSNSSKNDMPLIEYYNDMNDDQKAKFRKEAFIPDNVGLELEHFEEFYEKRKDLLAVKIRQILG